MSTLSLKLTFGEDIRRFAVSKEISYPELRGFLEKHLGVSHIIIKYIDDEEELVTIGSNIELAEAKRLQPEVLRLTVVQSKDSQKIEPPGEEKKKEVEYNACLVRDVTIADGSQVTVNTPFKKVWRLKNNGEADWPENVRLALVGPENYELGGSSSGVAVRALKIGQEADVAIDLQAPKKEGRYVGYWRLTSETEGFGPRFWVDVSVVASRADEEEAKRRLEAEKKKLEADREKKEEEEKMRRQKEEEEKVRLLREAEEKKQAEEEEAKKKAEEEAARIKAEEEARIKAEEEAKRKAEEEARIKAEEEAKKKAEEEIRMKAEEEAKKRAEEDAKRKAEEEARRKAEEEAKLPWANEVKLLVEMGFPDVKKNRELLVKYNGNVDQVIENLFMS